jgi:hypothetical protein
VRLLPWSRLMNWARNSCRWFTICSKILNMRSYKKR